MFEDIISKIQFLSPQDSQYLGGISDAFLKVGNPALYEQRKGSELQQAQIDAVKQKKQQQDALSRIMSGQGTPINPRDPNDTLRQAAMIDPESYLATYVKSQQPDYKYQEINGALVRYNANDPNAKPETVIAPQPKPLSEKEQFELKQAEEKEKARKEQGISQAGVIRDTVKQAIKQVDAPMTSGIAGQIGRYLGGSNAFELESTLETIKANLGFDRLQQMRDNSPTGGALGSVAVKELDALQSTVANLRIGQSDEQLKKNLKKIDEHYSKWADTMKKAGRSDMVESAPAKPSTIPDGTTATNKQGQKIIFKGGKWLPL